jgi:hypothetical protein
MPTTTKLTAVALAAVFTASSLVADASASATSIPHRAHDSAVVSNAGSGAPGFRSAQLRYVGGVGHTSTALPMPLYCPPPPRLPLPCR